MNEKIRRSTRRVVQAEDIREELTRKTSQSRADKPLLPLHHARILGKLDLKHLVVEQPLEMRNCEFEDHVDLRYCEFKQVVDLSGCTFRQSFNSGDEAESHTVYRKDFVANGAVFEGAVTLNGIRCEGGAHLNGAEFRNKEKTVDLLGASFGKTLELFKARFAGAVNFRYVQSDVGIFMIGARFWNRSQPVLFDGASMGTLDCTGVRFSGAVSLTYANCKNTGTFTNARFEFDRGASVNFTLASFGILNCQYTRFAGSAVFNSVKCGGTGFFTNARFEGEGNVDLGYASFGTYLDCSGATFYGGADLDGMECKYAAFRGTRFLHPWQEMSLKDASIAADLSCERGPKGPAVFRGPVAFNGLKCGGSGLMDGARFKGKVDLTHAAFDGNLECSDTLFSWLAVFHRMECKGSGHFYRARFTDKFAEVDFTNASFRALRCGNAEFHSLVDFGSLKCDESASFQYARFKGEPWVEGQFGVDFTYASFGQDLECHDARFRGPARFVRLNCGASGMFYRARFESDQASIFDLAHFGRNLRLRNAYFAGPVLLRGAHISQQLSLLMVQESEDGAAFGFKDRLELRSTTVGQLVLGESQHFQQDMLDLREFTFESFIGNGTVADQFAQAVRFALVQDPATFSRDPYLQFERYYNRIGDEAHAGKMHRKGRLALRDNAKDENGITQWSPRRNLLDWMWKWLAGYGVQVWRLLVISAAFLLIGAFVFYLPDNALTAVGDSGGSTSWQEAWVYRLAYSLDLFLPLVNLHIEENWTPSGPWLQAYAVGHAMVGWLLVPLMLAALAGIMRKRGQ